MKRTGGIAFNVEIASTNAVMPTTAEKKCVLPQRYGHCTSVSAVHKTYILESPDTYYSQLIKFSKKGGLI